MGKSVRTNSATWDEKWDRKWDEKWDEMWDQSRKAYTTNKTCF